MASPGDSSDGAPAPQASSSTSGSRDITMSCQLQNMASLTMRELQEITDNFSKERAIGEGAYGKVYRGTLDNGEEIAVKLLYNRIGSDDGQFRREFENLMRLEHHNIVRLVGYCYETQHKPMIYAGQTIFAEEISKALCFEYMQNGSLEKHLSGEHDGLDWHTRYKIIKGTCEGLQYLHKGLKEPIYHLDLKPENILLDENMVPKLADFGLSRLFGGQQTMMTQSLLGTIGYMPKEYISGHIISNKFDIFSLGVIMTKIIAGPNGHSRRAEMSHQEFLDQVHTNWRDRFHATWSSHKQLEAHCEQLNICTEIALSCMEDDRHKRPNISDIIHQLNDTEATIDEALSCSASSHLWMQKDLVKIKAFTESKVIPYTEVHNKFPVLVRVTSPPWRHADVTNSLWFNQNDFNCGTISTVMPTVPPSALSTSMGLNVPPENPRHGGNGVSSASFYWDGVNPSGSSSTGISGSNNMGFEPQSTNSILENSVFPWTDIGQEKDTRDELVEEINWCDYLNVTFAQATTVMQNQSQSLNDDVIKAESQQPQQQLQSTSDMYDKDLQRMLLSFGHIL